MGSMITITAADGGRFEAYLAEPPTAASGAAVPGLVLIQEIFGVNQVMRDLADDFASLGYRVLCPDLFWRQEPAIQLTDKSEAEWARAFQLFQGFNETLGVQDLIATLAHLRSMPGSSGKVGSVGYCLGGKLAFLMATRSTADCNVSYYGVGLDGLVGEIGAITRPLLMHIAEFDKFVPAAARDAVLAAMAAVPMADVHVYSGVDHAFARVGGEHYDAKAATLANERTRTFLKSKLS